jgi:hypothetical protein
MPLPFLGIGVTCDVFDADFSEWQLDSLLTASASGKFSSASPARVQ